MCVLPAINQVCDVYRHTVILVPSAFFVKKKKVRHLKMRPLRFYACYRLDIHLPRIKLIIGN